MSVINETVLFAGRGVRRFFRAPEAIAFAFLLPLTLLFLMLAVYGKIIGDAVHGSYVQRLTPLVLLMTAAFGAAGTALGMYRDLYSGFLNRIRTMPVSPGALLAGRVVGDALRQLAIALVTTLIAFLPGFRFHRGVPAALGFFGIVVLFGAMCSSVALWRAFGRSTPEAIQGAITGVATLLFLLSSGFVPVSAYPGVLQPVVRANPMSVATNALIGLSSGGPVLRPVLETLAWVVPVSLLCGLAAIRRYRRLTDR